jgi:hypothetical protein
MNMRKKISTLIAACIASLGFAQTGSIAIVSIPDQANAGETITIQLTYTSDVQVNVSAELFRTQAGSNNCDYTTWQAATTADNKAPGTNVPVSITFTIPAATTPTASLTNRNYTFQFKLIAVTGGGEFGYNNNTADNIITILPSTTVVDNIDFVTTPASSVAKGGNITFDFAYTLTETRNVKAGLAIYSSTGTYLRNAEVNGSEVAQYFSDEPATTTTPVQKTASITIPAGILASNQLASGEVYKLGVSIFSTSWAYITDKKVDITITSGTDIAAIDASQLSIIPQGDVCIISAQSTINTVRINSVSGATVNIPVSIDGQQATLTTSGLAKGTYIIQAATATGTISGKLVL